MIQAIDFAHNAIEAITERRFRSFQGAALLQGKGGKRFMIDHLAVSHRRQQRARWRVHQGELLRCCLLLKAVQQPFLLAAKAFFNGFRRLPVAVGAKGARQLAS